MGSSGNRMTKYRRAVAVLLIIFMGLTQSAPFISYALGVEDESIEDSSVVELDTTKEEDKKESDKDKHNENPPEDLEEESPKEPSILETNNEEYIKDDGYAQNTEPESSSDNDEAKGTKDLTKMIALAEPVYELADETEFKNPDLGVNGGNMQYLGTKQYVEIPNKIYRWSTPTYSNMFAGKKVKGVKSTNKTVTSMEYMFKSLQSTVLDVGQLYTGNATTMQGMFKEAKVLDLDLSNYDTSKVSNMTEMFRDSKIESLDMSRFNTIYVITMERMFQDTYITDIDITSFNTERVKNMTGMFSGAKANRIQLGNLSTANVTDMKEMFKGTVAKDLDVSSFNTTKVVNMRDMFNGSNAEVLNLTRFDTTNVTDMSNMFNSSKASKIDMSSFNTENVYNMVNMFQGAGATELNLENFKTSKITDMSGLFKDAKATKINVSNFDTTYVTDMSEMFMNTKVNELDLSSFDMSSVNDTTDMFKGTTATKGYARTQEDADKLNNSTGKPAGLTFKSRYVVPEDKDFLGSTNGDFRYIGKDEYIEMPHKIKEIPVVSYKSMFEGTSVKGVVSTNKNIKDMTRMFYGNTATNLDVSKIDTTGVTTMGSMFEKASTKTLKLTNFDTIAVAYTGYMFSGTKLDNIDLGSFNMVNVKNTEGMFQGSTISQGYARTKEDATKLNTSTFIPKDLKFTVWSIIATPSTTEWTNKNITVTAKGESEVSGVGYIDMVSNGDKGVNLIRNGNFQDDLDLWSLSASFKRTIDSEGIHITVPKESSWARLYSNSTIFKNMKKGETYTLTYETKTDTTRGRNVNIALGTAIGEIFKKTPVYTAGGWEEHELTFTTTGDSLSSNDFRLQMWLDQHLNPTESNISFRKIKLERGDKATPFSLAPEDVKLVNNQKDYEVSENGTYIFRLVDKDGNTKEVAHTVTNIDYTNPTATLTSSPEGWTSGDVKIYVKAKDDLSGVDYITLPNGEKVSSTTAEYKVPDNGKYTFKVTDKAGNTETFTKEISNIDKDVPELYATVQNKAWTRDTVNIEVESKESLSGLTDIAMINSPEEGRNYLSKSNIDIRLTKDSNFVQTQEYISVVSGIDLTKTFLGKNTLLSYDLHSLGGREDNPRESFAEDIRGRFGIHGAIVWRDSKGKDKDVVNYPYASLLHSEKDNERVSMKHKVNHYNYDTVASYAIAIQPFAKPSKDNNEEWHLRNVKLEIGEVDTPWTPAPEDIKLINNKKVYPVASNGLYTFKATYNNGKTSEASVNVTNIDRTPPEVKISGNIEDWTKADDITLTINATDTQSGVKSITLPDKKVVNGNKATFKVTKNDTYTFTVEDNVGNVTTHTETVDRLMVPYTFYIYDSNGKPLKGFEYDLLRDGQVHSKAVSDVNGLVNFGKVPATGKYTIKQTKAPDGFVVNPDEKEVEVGDTTEPEEFVGYPRGDELPGTGTSGTLVYIVIVLGVVTCTIYLRRKKSKVD